MYFRSLSQGQLICPNCCQGTVLDIPMLRTAGWGMSSPSAWTWQPWPSMGEPGYLHAMCPAAACSQEDSLRVLFCSFSLLGRARAGVWGGTRTLPPGHQKVGHMDDDTCLLHDAMHAMHSRFPACGAGTAWRAVYAVAPWWHPGGRVQGRHLRHESPGLAQLVKVPAQCKATW